MTCREFITFLIEYLSGELAESERAVFDRHLSLCPACVAYLRNYQRTIALGRAAYLESDDPVPSDVPEPLVRAILAARSKSRSGS